MLAAATLLLGGCTDEPEPEPSPTPTAAPSPSPTPSPTPEIEPVDGQLEVELTSVSVAGNRVFVEGSDRDRAADPDAAAIDAFTAGIKTFLDGYLDRIQSRQPDATEPVLPFDLGDDTVLLAAISTDLASPSDPIRNVVYDTTVYVDQAPEWASVVASITTDDGTSTQVTYVFVPGEAEPELIAAAPGGGG